MRVTLIGASKDQATNEAMKKVALASLNGIDPTILRHKQEFFDVLLQRKPHSIAELVEVVDSYAD